MKSPSKTAILVALTILASSAVLWFGQGSHSERRSSPDDPTKQSGVASVAASNRAENVIQNAKRSQQAFATMDVLERNSILMDIKKQDFATILRMLFEAGRVEKDLTKQGAIANVLAIALQERVPDPNFLRELENFILDGSKNLHERGQIIGVLNAAATKESVDILIHVAASSSDQGLKRVAIAGIGRLGQGGGDNETLSPALERVWRESTDPDLLTFVAAAMAQIGSSRSVEMLLASAFDSKNRDEVRSRMAQGAFAYATMLNPNAVPALAARLENDSPDRAASKLASETLVKMGIPAAGDALVNWLRNANESAAPSISNIVMRTRTETMLAQWEMALNPALTFRSEKNREALKDGLVRYRQGIR